MFFLGIYTELDRYRITVKTRLDTLQSRSDNLQTRLDTMQTEHCKVLRLVSQVVGEVLKPHGKRLREKSEEDSS
jgi:hypothetical protein